MTPRQLQDAEELERLLAAPRVLLFKHSPICPVSSLAFAEYRRFLEAEGSLPFETVWIDVIDQRPLSNAVAERTGLVHQSPQAILLEAGEPRWDASHDGITVSALAEATGSQPSSRA